MDKNMTLEQKKMDEFWDELILIAQEKGYIIHQYQGVALLSKHEMQLKTRKLSEYFKSQHQNGVCLLELGYKDCHKEKCKKCSEGNEKKDI